MKKSIRGFRVLISTNSFNTILADVSYGEFFSIGNIEVLASLQGSEHPIDDLLYVGEDKNAISRPLKNLIVDSINYRHGGDFNIEQIANVIVLERSLERGLKLILTTTNFSGYVISVSYNNYNPIVSVVDSMSGETLNSFIALEDQNLEAPQSLVDQAIQIFSENFKTQRIIVV